jgi:hypothetical protein
MGGFLISLPPIGVTVFVVTAIIFGPIAHADLLTSAAWLFFHVGWMFDLYITAHRKVSDRIPWPATALFGVTIAAGVLLLSIAETWPVTHPSVTKAVYAVGYLTCVAFAANALVRSERAIGANPRTHVGIACFLIFMLPVGIWFLWPRLKRLVASEPLRVSGA